MSGDAKMSTGLVKSWQLLYLLPQGYGRHWRIKKGRDLVRFGLFSVVTVALCEGALEGQRAMKGRSGAQQCPRQPSFELVRV